MSQPMQMVDSVMATALQQADHPGWAVDDLVASGGLREVYRRVYDRQAQNGGGATVEVALAVLDEVLAERAAQGLEPSPETPPDDAAARAPRHSSFFPVLGADTAFPPPREEGEGQADVTPEGDVSEPDLRASHRTIALLRLETVMVRWRKGEIDADEALGKARSALDTWVPQDDSHTASPDAADHDT